MTTSKLLEKQKKLQDELDKGIRDPKRKLQVEAYLKVLERDIGAIGFDQSDREKYLPGELEKPLDK